jgi:ubiquinone/menaquinone biosynthesis C-methylase UbiE
MQPADEIARMNLEVIRREIKNGEEFTIPWLDLDVEAYRAYRQGESARLPRPYCDDPADRALMESVQGLQVLCLAGGGGQQSAVYTLLGASVTVFDLAPEQLEADQAAARHYGYQVTTLQGDMRDLSSLPSGSFDRVHQPISTLFVPDLRQVYAGVARLLKPSGLYRADYTFPLLYMAEMRAWDGKGYSLYVTQPYRDGAIRETAAGFMSYDTGPLIGEFHHTLSAIVNGLIAEGLVIRGVWETPRIGTRPALETLEPGSEAHRARYLPFGITVVAGV